MCSWEEFYGFLLYHLNLTLGMVLHMLVSPFKLVVASFLNFYLSLASPLRLCCCTWATSSCGEQRLLSSCGAWVSHCDGFSCCRCQLKKDVQLESCKLSFIWDKVRTAAWEAASQTVLSELSEMLLQSGSGESQYIRFWWRGRSMPWSTQFIKDFLLVMRIWCHYEGI